MKIKQIYEYIDQNFAFENQEDWDFSGLNFGNLNHKINSDKISISLDLTTNIIKKAIANNINTFIIHHPIIFNENIDEELNNFRYKKKIVDLINNHHLNIISLHTNYDINDKGMKQNLKNLLPLKNEKNLKYGSIYKLKKNFLEIEKFLKKQFDLKIIDHNIDNKKIIFGKIMIFPGAGGEEAINQALDYKCNLLITSDLKWSHWIYAYESKIKIIQISHGIEEIFNNHLKKILLDKFSNLDIKIFNISKEIKNEN